MPTKRNVITAMEDMLKRMREISETTYYTTGWPAIIMEDHIKQLKQEMHSVEQIMCCDNVVEAETLLFKWANTGEVDLDQYTEYQRMINKRYRKII